MKTVLSFVVTALVVCTAVVSGHAQAAHDLAATPQGKAVLAYYKAANAGDMAALKKTITVESAKELDGPNGKDLVKMLKEMTPIATPAIVKVNVTGKTAAVDAQVKEGATTTTDHVKVVMVGTDWKVDTTGK